MPPRDSPVRTYWKTAPTSLLERERRLLQRREMALVIGQHLVMRGEDCVVTLRSLLEGRIVLGDDALVLHLVEGVAQLLPVVVARDLQRFGDDVDGVVGIGRRAGQEQVPGMIELEFRLDPLPHLLCARAEVPRPREGARYEH